MSTLDLAILATVFGILVLAGLIVWIVDRERRPYPPREDYPHEHGDGES